MAFDWKPKPGMLFRIWFGQFAVAVGRLPRLCGWLDFDKWFYFARYEDRAIRWRGSWSVRVAWLHVGRSTVERVVVIAREREAFRKHDASDV